MINFQSTQFNSSSVKNEDNKNDIIPYLDETFYKKQNSENLNGYLYWEDTENIGKNLNCIDGSKIIQIKLIIQLNDFNFLLYSGYEIFIYDELLEEELNKIKFTRDIYSIYETKSRNNTVILISSNEGYLDFLKFNVKFNEVFDEEENIGSKLFLFLEIDINKYIISINQGTFFRHNNIKNLKELSNEKCILKEVFEIGKIINDKNVVLINNKNILILYNIQTNKIQSKKFKYSFILSKNCIDLMNLEDEKFKVLIICCENGILILKLEIDNDGLLKEDLYEYFYDLNKSCNNYCIKCLCLIKKKNILRNFDSFYFMVYFIDKKKNEERLRICSLKGIKDKYPCPYEGFIKININDNNEVFKKTINNIHQIIYNGCFVLFSSSEGILKKFELEKIISEN